MNAPKTWTLRLSQYFAHRYAEIDSEYGTTDELEAIDVRGWALEWTIGIQSANRGEVIDPEVARDYLRTWGRGATYDLVWFANYSSLPLDRWKIPNECDRDKLLRRCARFLAAQRHIRPASV